MKKSVNKTKSTTKVSAKATKKSSVISGKKRSSDQDLEIEDEEIRRNIRATNKKKQTSLTSDMFPVVGIGSSAGGLEAFLKLISQLPADLGMAYVYIQHLSPDHESFLPDIIQRKTKMKVLKIKDRMKLEKNTVFVIPAKSGIAIRKGLFEVRDQDRSDGLHAIDYFLTSIAPIYQQNAIGILLSGTGTDGTLGLMSIKAEGGLTFAQDNSANHSGMPHNAAEMGYVDFVMPPEKIASELASIVKHPYALLTQNDVLLENKSTLRKIHAIMNSKRGVDFSYYKQTTIHRRIMRRMVMNKIKDLERYFQLLKESKPEVDALYHDLLITVTSFFRDPVMYEAFTNKLLPQILKSRKQNDPIRIWIPGCATGEEAVSFAIILLEKLGEKAISTQIQIFATDLNLRAIERARSGIYMKSSLVNVSPERIKKFFIKSNNNYQVIKTIRDMCIYAPHNLLKDPPFSRIDIISCQNVLIYLEALPQNKIMHAFHYALKPTGYLLLGKSETIGSATDLFEQKSKQYKIYTKKIVNTPVQLDFVMRTYPVYEQADEIETETKIVFKEPDLEKETDKILLSRYMPASVLVNKDLEILRFRGPTSRFLEPAAGKASLNLLKMIKEELIFDVRTIIQRVKKERRSLKRNVIMGLNGDARQLQIEVIPVANNGKENFLLIVFNDHGPAPRSGPITGKSGPKHAKDFVDKRVENLEAQVREARESIKIITEDFEATKEELQSANEEVLSSNEELQSINEELETSKEELQSTNEELTTINEELNIRNHELKDAADFRKAVVETMHESLVILTADFRVKDANKGFYKTFETLPEDTEGQNFFDLAHNQWDYPQLRKQLKMIQSHDVSLVDFELEVVLPSSVKKTVLINAHKILLKDGADSMILLTILDLTSRKKMEESLKENEERFRLLIQNSSDIIGVFDEDGNIKYESPAVEGILGYKPEERIGKNITLDPLVHPDDLKTKIDLIRTSLERPYENISGEFRLKHKDGSYRVIDAIFRNMIGDKKINGIIANYRDITERRIFQQQKDEFIGIASHELKTPVTSIKAYAQILEDTFRKAKDAKSTELVSKMNTQVDRLTTLIIDLLDFTKIEGGSLKFREEEYKLNALIKEIVEEVKESVKTHDIVLKLDKEVKMNGDKYRTGQVLSNLLSNAVKYSPKGKKVILESRVQKKEIVISVTDFGIGIDEEQLDRVFDRFFRVTQASLNTFPGLGLGLFIAAEFIKRQGGKMWAKSKKNKGSTFFFSLPITNN